MGATVEMRGTVKWYNAAKGFGFVVVPEGGKDVFIHVSVLEQQGLTNLAEGQAVVMQVAQGAKGPKPSRSGSARARGAAALRRPAWRRGAATPEQFGAARGL